MTDATTTHDGDATVPAPISVPSPEFWTVTPFEFTPSAGWSARPTASHLVYAAADDDAQADLGIRWSRTSVNVDLRVVANARLAALRRLDANAVSRSAHFVRIGGVVGYLRLTDFTKPVDDPQPDGERVRFGQVYVVIPGPMFGADRPRELFEFAGHFPAADGVERSKQIRSMIGSFSFRLVPAAGQVDVASSSPDTADLVDDIVDLAYATERSDAR